MQSLPIEPLADESEPKPIDLKEVVVYGIGRSRLLIALIACVAGAVAAVVAVSIPNNYTASASLRFTPGLREQRLAPEVSLGMDVRAVAPSIVEEILLLEDPLLFRRVAERYGAERVLVPADPGQYDTPSTAMPVRMLHGFQRWILERGGAGAGSLDTDLALDTAAKVLWARTEFVPVPRSNIIRVTHTASSKERSVELLQLIVEACVEQHRERYGTEEEFERGRAREADLYSQLQSAKLDFREYRAECGVDDIKVARERVLARLGDIDEQIAELENTLGSNAAEVEFLRSLAESMEPEIEEVQPAVRASNPRYESLVAERERAAIDLEVLVKDESLPFDEKERQQRTLEARIAQYDARLKGVEAFVIERPETRSNRPNPDWVALQRQIRQIEGLRRATATRLEAVEVDREDQLAELEHIRGCEETHTLLSETIEDFETDYEAVAARNDQLEDLRRLDESGASNLAVYTEPRRPDSKNGPPRSKIAIGGLAGGLLLGLALAVLRQLLDPRIRYPRTVEVRFGMPVLCTVPEARGLKRLRKLSPAR